MSKTVLMCAAGTGGHVIPALTLAKALRSQGVHVIWVGGHMPRLEHRLVPEAGFELVQLPMLGVKGKGWRGWLRLPLMLIRAFVAMQKVLETHRPSVVVCMGGYVCVPAGCAAWFRRVPLVIHEQNAVPGWSNRLLSFLAKRVFEAFPKTFPSFLKATTVGNPLRAEVLSVTPAFERPHRDRSEPWRVLVLGGSLGARALNHRVPEQLKRLAQRHPLEIWHQTGPNDVESTQQRYEPWNPDVRVTPFIERMEEAYAFADVVISRSGALTLSELAAVGMPSVLIPFPHAVDDHQRLNAEPWVSSGAGWMCLEPDIEQSLCWDELAYCLSHAAEWRRRSEAAYALRRVQATEAIVSACLTELNERGVSK